MASHRKHRVRAHKAQRRIENPSRRVRLNAEAPAPRPALEASLPAESDLSPTVPIMLGEQGIALLPSRIGPARTGPDDSALDGGLLGDPLPRPPGRSQRWRVRRAVRGLLMTPWFAASTGFVIAAGLWVYSPHASIRFPSAI